MDMKYFSIIIVNKSKFKKNIYKCIDVNKPLVIVINILDFLKTQYDIA
jgi:hypothetical protein